MRYIASANQRWMAVFNLRTSTELQKATSSYRILHRYDGFLERVRTGNEKSNNGLGQSYMDTLILTSLLVWKWEYLRSPAKNLVHFLQGIWLIGHVGFVICVISYCQCYVMSVIFFWRMQFISKIKPRLTVECGKPFSVFYDLWILTVPWGLTQTLA